MSLFSTPDDTKMLIFKAESERFDSQSFYCSQYYCSYDITWSIHTPEQVIVGNENRPTSFWTFKTTWSRAVSGPGKDVRTRLNISELKGLKLFCKPLLYLTAPVAIQLSILLPMIACQSALCIWQREFCIISISPAAIGVAVALTGPEIMAAIKALRNTL